MYSAYCRLKYSTNRSSRPYDAIIRSLVCRHNSTSAAYYYYYHLYYYYHQYYDYYY